MGILGGVKFLFRTDSFAMVLLDFTIVGIGYYRPLLRSSPRISFTSGSAGYGMPVRSRHSAGSSAQ